ncbi:MAG: hypothetical protein QOG31_1412 [Thermoplasmata archaeon]|jgi:hypothetical protein|nr:hypothetical protein [Thermoplasmata archaeon]
MAKKTTSCRCQLARRDFRPARPTPRARTMRVSWPDGSHTHVRYAAGVDGRAGWWPANEPLPQGARWLES